jgi:hypothetical protein
METYDLPNQDTQVTNSQIGNTFNFNNNPYFTNEASDVLESLPDGEKSYKRGEEGEERERG